MEGIGLELSRCIHVYISLFCFSFSFSLYVIVTFLLSFFFFLGNASEKRPTFFLLRSGLLLTLERRSKKRDLNLICIAACFIEF